MKLPRSVVAVAIGIAMTVAACGDDGGGVEARTVEVDMVDTAFEPDRIEVATGETVRFVFTNRGKVAHDAFIGDTAAQADHEKEMRDAEAGDHGGDHGDDDDAVTVEPGDTEELTYTFDKPGTLEIGCHQAGHYEGGMKIAVQVT